MTAVPYCNVPVAQPVGDPTPGTGFQRIPANSSLDQMMQIINNNFALLLKGNFHEDRALRVSRIVTLTDAQNPTVKIDVEVINAVTFRNTATGQTVVWKR